jgi:ubiquinone/menaquinone biosynthesis C-methylase UbiE
MVVNRDRYRFHAKIYDRFYEPAATRLRNTGLKMFPPRENLSILDVGCGTGTQLALYQRTGCTLFGIDLSPAMLTVARRKLGETATLQLEDASKLTFDSGTFDLVTAVLILHEIQAGLRSAVLRECTRVVKADGRIMLMDYHFGPYPFPIGWMWKLFATLSEISAGREHYANYRDFLNRRGLETLIAEHSLTVDKQFVFESGVAAVFLLKP